MLEANGILNRQMKEKLRKVQGIRAVAESKMEGRNLMEAICTWAVSVVRYAGGNNHMEETGVTAVRPKNKKTVDNEHRLPHKELCCKTIIIMQQH